VGVVAMAHGAVRWSGVDARLWHDVTLVPQSITLLDELTAADNVRLPSLLATRRPPERAPEVLDALGLTRLRDRLVGQISVGERQRTMVARAVATPSMVLLADEPTAHQDDGHARRVIELLRAETLRGRTCIVATRDPEPWMAGGPARLVELPARVGT
jgi:putative ABC transport system ATP-binding protein